MQILIISDVHYACLAAQQSSERVHGALGRVLLKKVFRRLAHMHVRPDVAVLLGDLTDNGRNPTASLDMLALNSDLVQCGIPTLVVAGNHDTSAEDVQHVFGTKSGFHEIGGFGFYVFNDMFDVGHVSSRSIDALSDFIGEAKAHPGMPLIALQHAPVYPAIASNYPYRLKNAAAVMQAYKRAGVTVSLSGHYHTGQKPRMHDNVLYYTVPALCEAPFSFALMTVQEGKPVEVEELSLALDCLAPLTDVHCHTEYAYCGTTTDTATNIAVSRAMGVSKLCVVEHAFQLYFPKHEAMRFAWQTDVDAVKRAWQTPGRGRMAAYRNFAEHVRVANPDVKIGLELDLYDGDKLLLAEEDAAGWDVLIGAIHHIPGECAGMTQTEGEVMFMREVERFVRHDIHVLAHPFRWFGWRNTLTRPKALYKELVGLLSDNNVALEVNFHTNNPDPELIRLAVEAGVRIALGTDTHDNSQAGELWPHMHALAEAGIEPKDYARVLYTP